MITLNENTRLLFIGDSITDCDRRKDPYEIGNGYVRMIRDHLSVTRPGNSPTVINRGISGNKMPDLQKRWKRDVIDQQPDVLSIFIGINDVWHSFALDRVGCNIDAYTAGYRDILTRTHKSLRKCAIVLCEPSVIWPPVHERGNELLQPYVRAVHAIAKEFHMVAAVVPLHGAFNSARDAKPEVALTTDGVHPTSAGHMLIAETWRSAIGL